MFKLAQIFSRQQLNDERQIQATTAPTVAAPPQDIKYDYEDELSAPMARNLSSVLGDRKACWLLLADTHGTLSMCDIKQYEDYPYTAIILLGDHSVADLQRLIMFTSADIPIYLIKGNHDEGDLLNDFCQFSPDKTRQITDISNRVVSIDGIDIACLAGSYKYKDTTRCMYTQEEAFQIAAQLSDADICLTHSNPYTTETKDLVHAGLKSITKYAYDHRIPLLIHGHIHHVSEKQLRNNTTVHSIYKSALLQLDNSLPNGYNLITSAKS